MVSTEVARGEVNELVGLSISAVNVSAQQCMEESPRAVGTSSLPIHVISPPEADAPDLEASVVDSEPCQSVAQLLLD